jgi:hypothetical protein
MRSLNLLLNIKEKNSKTTIDENIKKKIFNLFFSTVAIIKKNKKKLKRKKLVLSPVKKINGEIIENK